MSDAHVADRRRRQLAANRDEYGDRYALLTFLEPQAARAAADRRGELLAALSGRAETGCRGSKLDVRRLSPGCRLCAEGAWSCLFVNGLCNGRCFYCPTSQDEIGLPTTNTVSFRTPADYVAYLERFGFRGMSISGGEPLLTAGRAVHFVAAAKKRFGGGLHAWLYTNGSRVDRDILLRLRDAGLDEIRFDIGAAGYSLVAAASAVGIIPTVTVEIPAVPEEIGRLKGKMAEMADAGIRHLNLHQLRLTPYNFHRFAGRPYTYLHGDKVTVFESELTALELMLHGFDRGIDLPVNYCSFVYKNRFQRLAARRRNAPFVQKGFEDLTEGGLLRALAAVGERGAVAAVAGRFRDAGAAPELWRLASAGDRLFFAAALWPLVDWGRCDLLIEYSEAAQRPSVTYRHPFVEVKLTPTQKVIIERLKVCRDIAVTGDVASGLGPFFTVGGALPADGIFAGVAQMEGVEEGFQDYF